MVQAKNSRIVDSMAVSKSMTFMPQDPWSQGRDHTSISHFLNVRVASYVTE